MNTKADNLKVELRRAIEQIRKEERAKLLRSEIEKLEGMKKDPSKGRLSGYMMFLEGFNQALTTIITRYKEELKAITGE